MADINSQIGVIITTNQEAEEDRRETRLAFAASYFVPENNKRALDVLLLLISHSGAEMDNNYGLAMVGQNRRWRTRVRLNLNKYKKIELSEQELQTVVPLYAFMVNKRRMKGGLEEEEEVEGGADSFMQMVPSPNAGKGLLKEYIVGANSEINRLKIEMSVLSIQLNEREE